MYREVRTSPKYRLATTLEEKLSGSFRSDLRLTPISDNSSFRSLQNRCNLLAILYPQNVNLASDGIF